MQLSLSFCRVQFFSHIGHMTVSFASQISLLHQEIKTANVYSGMTDVYDIHYGS